MCGLPLAHTLMGTWSTTQTYALGWELNWQPFGLQASAQSTEPHEPGLFYTFKIFMMLCLDYCTIQSLRHLLLKVRMQSAVATGHLPVSLILPHTNYANLSYGTSVVSKLERSNLRRETCFRVVDVTMREKGGGGNEKGKNVKQRGK